MMEDGHCVRTVHSEANAIIQAAKAGTSIEGATIYVTASPCWYCFKLIANAGIKRIVFGEVYRDERITQFAKSCGIATLLLGKSWDVEVKAKVKSVHVLGDKRGKKKTKRAKGKKRSKEFFFGD